MKATEKEALMKALKEHLNLEVLVIKESDGYGGSRLCVEARLSWVDPAEEVVLIAEDRDYASLP